jgi:hypothetical protein
VILGSPENRDDAPPGVEVMIDSASNPNLPIAARSDQWRWWALSVLGGFYSDTDVIFIRSVENVFRGEYDAWITSDLGTEVDDTEVPKAQRLKISIGVLGARRNSMFFARAYEIARRVPTSTDYQSHGTRLLATYWDDLTKGVRLGQIPSRLFYGHGGSTEKQVRDLWGPDIFGQEEVGLHWYGGSPASKPYLNATSKEQLPDSWVRKALER